MRNETLAALEAFFQKSPILKAGPVLRTEVDAAFARFRFPLPEDYLSYVERYGGAIIGPYRVFGLMKAAPMGAKEASALEVTDRFVKQGWPGTENWLIISTDPSGNPIGLAVDEQVWISDHDNGQIPVYTKRTGSGRSLPLSRSCTHSGGVAGRARITHKISMGYLRELLEQ